MAEIIPNRIRQLTGSSVTARFQLYTWISGGHWSESGKEDAAFGRSSPGELDPVDPSRRDFVVRCCQGASGAPRIHRPARSRLSFAFDFSILETWSHRRRFPLTPSLSRPYPLDSTLLKTPGRSRQVRHRKISRPNRRNSSGMELCLLRSPQDVQGFEKALASDFSGSSLRPIESQLLRSGHRLRSVKTSSHGRLLWKGSLSSGTAIRPEPFSKIVTAESK